ncbi:cytochrome P450 monooxygenase pc-2 [Trametes elegans]|nr:cytochrome P450 monooxygenase pc-2 [Trametes elegans]
MKLHAQLPPGVPFVLRGIAVTVLPSVTVVLLLSHVLNTILGFALPGIVVLLAAVFSVPVGYALRIALTDWRIRMLAARTGAILPPRWDGKSLGNVDLFRHVLERFNNGYLGEGAWDKIDELGHLHSITALWDTTYFTNDASVVKAILATEFSNFEKGPAFRATMHSVLGTGVFNSDGEMWKFHRQMTRPYFSRDRISHFELFDRHANLAIKKLKHRFAGGHAVDFQDIVSRFTLDSATEFLFGACVNSLETDLPYAHNDPVAPRLEGELSVAERFSAAFAGAQHVIAVRSRIGWGWPLNEIRRDHSAEHMTIVDAFLEPILREAIMKNRAAKGRVVGPEKDEADESETLLDHLVKFTDDPVILHDETLNILIAGRDTTAATLTFAVYLMCLYPHIFERLRAEVLEKVGPTRMPSFEDVRNMKYLRAVINETLRLYPTVPFNVRVSNRDTTIPNPDPSAPRVFIPAQMAVAYSVFLMHRRKDYWGPDALDFDPNRWLDERLNKYFTANPFIFAPFNAGPRICLGQQFAYNEMSLFLVRLLQNFSGMELDLYAQPPDARPPPEWAAAEGQKGREKIIPRCHLSLYVQGGLWLKMTEASEGDN